MELHDHICDIQNMSLKSTSDNPSEVSQKLLLIELGDIGVPVHFAAMEKQSVPLLVATSFIERFVWSILLMECFFVPDLIYQLTFISDYTPLSN